jgi:glycerophosphoryl diester phosphodiesterase
MAAFHSAVALGADMVEIDLRRTRDNQIVVVHDPTLERLWGVPRAVADLNGAEVQAVDGDVSGQGIPTFAQVLRAIHLPLMVDFTKRDVVEGALAVVAHSEGDALERCLFVSGNIEALRLLRSLSASARIGLTWVEEAPPAPELLRELAAEYWNPMWSRVTPERVAAIHQMGLKVSTWTVDRRRDMRALREAGVDAIVSNQIARLVRTLG